MSTYIDIHKTGLIKNFCLKYLYFKQKFKQHDENNIHKTHKTEIYLHTNKRPYNYNY